MTDGTRMIDWNLAVRLGSRVAGDGPVISPAEAADCVEELRTGAEKSSPLVREFTGLIAQERTAPVLVVDRGGWVRANATSFEKLTAPLIRSMEEKLGDRRSPGLTEAIGSRVTGVEVGAMLGFMAGKVLGQFDPLHDAPGEAGRLLLVAPNVAHVESELDVDPHDFRLWVCLHEETHRVQVTAVPWMRDHMFTQIQKFAGTMEPGGMLEEGLGRILERTEHYQEKLGARFTPAPLLLEYVKAGKKFH